MPLNTHTHCGICNGGPRQVSLALPSNTMRWPAHCGAWNLKRSLVLAALMLLDCSYLRRKQDTGTNKATAREQLLFIVELTGEKRDEVKSHSVPSGHAT